MQAISDIQRQTMSSLQVNTGSYVGFSPRPPTTHTQKLLTQIWRFFGPALPYLVEGTGQNPGSALIQTATCSLGSMDLAVTQVI